MTEKLLSKPPFRYLHDIFTATNAATGFGNGLYSGPELDGKAIADKEGKVSYLTKMISLTELVIGEEIDVRPAKIVAGQEPDKTNFLLQAMFKAATAGIDTTPHVNQVLGIEGDDGGEDDGDAQARAEQEAAEAQANAEHAKKKKRAEQKQRQQEEEQRRVQEEEDNARAQQEADH
jgi:TRAF3-interacting protein 1